MLFLFIEYPRKYTFRMSPLSDMHISSLGVHLQNTVVMADLAGPFKQTAFNSIWCQQLRKKHIHFKNAVRLFWGENNT